MRGAGRTLFAAIMLVMLGTLNIIYGIGALDDANIFVGDTRFILDDLNTLGWVLIIVGVLQLTGGFSLMGGGGLRKVHRHPRRHPGRRQRLLLDRRRLSLVVDLDVHRVHLDRPRPHHVRRGPGVRREARLALADYGEAPARLSAGGSSVRCPQARREPSTVRAAVEARSGSTPRP